MLDRADDATAIILAPSDAELRAALDTLSALRNSGYDNPIVVAVEAGDVRDLRNDSRAVEARARGASTTISQALAPEHVLLNATFMLPDAIQTALRDSTPPSAPRPAPLRHGRLRVEDGRAYLGRRELDLERSEYDTLVFLLENRGRAVCERHYWEQKRVSLSPGAFRTRICNLRDKLRDSKGSLIQLSSTQPGHYGIGI